MRLEGLGALRACPTCRRHLLRVGQSARLDFIYTKLTCVSFVRIQLYQLRASLQVPPAFQILRLVKFHHATSYSEEQVFNGALSKINSFQNEFQAKHWLSEFWRELIFV